MADDTGSSSLGPGSFVLDPESLKSEVLIKHSEVTGFRLAPEWQAKPGSESSRALVVVAASRERWAV